MQVTPIQTVPFIMSCMKANIVPMLSGDPGIGKSCIITDIAKQCNLHVIDIRLSQCDPTDLNGFPTFKDGKATYSPMDIWPIESTKIPDGKNGFLIFLDEFNSASVGVQAASYKLILDRKVGQYNLHPRTKIITAGNLSTNNAIVNRLSTAMQSRMVHLELVVDVKSWLIWASKNNIDTRVTSYIGLRPDNLHNFKPDHNDKTFACPRTWEFVSNLIANDKSDLRDQLPLLAGTISEAVAREFQMHTELCIKLPTIDMILKDPTNIKIDRDEPALLYGASYMVAANINISNIDTLIKYINRLPIEFQTITLQTSIKRLPELIKHQSVKDWIVRRGSDLF